MQLGDNANDLNTEKWIKGMRDEEEIATQVDSGHDVRDSNVGSEEDIKHANKKRSVTPKKANAAAAGMTKVAAKMR